MKKDLFSESKKLAMISRSLRRVFELWGYEEVFLPAIEPYREELREGIKFTYNNEFYLIKPDITSQIAVNLRNPKRLKLFYISEVLKVDLRGNWQAGIEYIGGESVWSEVEVLKVAITALDYLGIEKFYIDIGSLEIWRKAIEPIREFEDLIWQALRRRNFEMVRRLPIGKEKKEELWKLMNFRKKKSGTDKIDKIVDAVSDDRLFVDFGTVRPLPYYDDIIFEIYSPKFECLLGGGGSYKIGGIKAVGFALDLWSISELYRGGKCLKKKVIKEKTPKEAYSIAEDFVKLGIPIEVKAE